MKLSQLQLKQPDQKPLETSSPLVEVTGVGVKYRLGGKREDVQSLVYKAFPSQGRSKERKKPELWALQDVHIVGQGGDVLGIIGANGAGKTTLCRVLSSLLRPDSGTVGVRGTVSALLSLGVGFKPELSGRDNVLLNGMLCGFSKVEMQELLPHIVEFAGLERFIDQPLKKYSTGMRSRLGFSIAAMGEPDILIVDEALSVGDLEFSARAGKKMQELVSAAKLVIVVTHQLEFVEQYCTRVVWLERGMVKMSGLPHEVVSDYKAVMHRATPVRTVVDLGETPAPLGTVPVVTVHDLGVRFALVKQAPTGWTQLLPPWKARSEWFWALQDVSFTVNEGEILGIIGRNGSGKSTLCRVLSMILHADHGQVAVNGNLSALLTFGAGFNTQLTGSDNIYLNGMMLGVSKRMLTDLYPEIVQFSGLASFIDEPVKHYSQGMRIRLGFSIAATIRPEVLILDEALSVGDLAFYDKASAKVQELIAHAKAVIVVTHNMAFVEKVCTRALWLDNGSVRFTGSPRETIAEYRQSVAG